MKEKEIKDDLKGELFTVLDFESVIGTDKEESLLSTIDVVVDWAFNKFWESKESLLEREAEEEAKAKMVNQAIKQKRQAQKTELKHDRFKKVLDEMKNSGPFHKVYTDGACSPNPGKGAWSFLFLPKEGGKGKYCETRYCEASTNNQEELKGVINALKYLLKEGYYRDSIVIFTDSDYVVKGALKPNGYETNKSFWLDLIELKKQFKNLRIDWVKGHSVSKGNNLADELAVYSLQFKEKVLIKL